MSSLTFLGAAGTVTGSKHLLEIDGHRILIDCGLFQGAKELRSRNWEPLPIDPGTIEVVVLTHAHLDHCGYLPRLVAAGFRGRVFCTPATKELTALVLMDSARLQEEDAKEANRYGYSRHNPALPLYTQVDAARAIDRLQPVGYERPIPLWSQTDRSRTVGAESDSARSPVGAQSEGVATKGGAQTAVGTGVGAHSASGRTATVEFVNAGHLLGSAYARIRFGERAILFGGDLGRYGRPVLPDPSPITEADYVLVEATYGDRLHDADDGGEQLATIVRDTAKRGGKLIIPAFAIGRVEELLYWLKRLEDAQRTPMLPVFVDSPMAIAALQYYSARLNELDAEIAMGSSGPGSDGSGRSGGSGGPGGESGAGRARAGARHVAGFATRRLTLVASAQQSADLVASRQPSIVIASSGMATGGRVLRHLAATLPHPRNTILFAGFQAPGTRGRSLVDGAKEIKLLGRSVQVAARIERLESMSAHADAAEIMRWLSGISRPPLTTYLVHGEPGALDALAARIRAERSWPVHIAAYRESVRIDLE
jgi:metallo-beta-lactamase family protein